MNGALPERDWERGEPAQGPVLSMSASKTITYRIEHARGPVFERTDDTLADAVAGIPVFVVVDDGLWPAYGAAIEQYALEKLDCLGIERIAGNESTKSLESVARMCAAALDVSLPRHGAFIAVGGGTILDAVGFAASIYRRGIAYIRVPTTLIGMIDVGVGIKQAINFNAKKNVLGSFYPPRRTINDVRFLWSLPRTQLACGIAEALKIALVCDRRLFELLEEHAALLVATGFRSPRSVATDVLLRAEAAMMEQLATNLFEFELRRLVDFGHSFSPIIETMSDYSVPHGDAVALDMLLSTAIAAGRNICEAGLPGRLMQLYAQIGLPATHPLMSPLLMERALIDVRAHRGGALNFVVPTEIGSADFLQDVSYDEIARALAAIAHLCAA